VNPQSGQTVLDLAAGTGSSSIVFAKPGVKVIASDFSEGMLAVGRKRHPELEFVYADATALPFKSESVDAVTISFGLRNVVDPNKALTEMLRVLKSGGVVVICEFSHLRAPVIGGLYRWYLRNVLPKLSKVLAKNKGAYDYLAESIEAWPKQEVLVDWLTKAGFVSASYKNLSLGIVALHTAKKAAK
jgi:demethylmenaquinone methyltransferase/2-methoxy-6-polyprenyl-1,4-benzoquinol methylase